MTELRGSTVHLRTMTTDDVGERYERWMNDPAITAHLESRFRAWTRDDLLEFVRAASADPASHLFTIRLADGDEHVGNIKLGPIETHHRRGDIGIIVGERSCWGRGVATEAISLLAEWAFTSLGLAKLTAGAYGTNVGSVRAFERAGFHVEARRPDHYRSGDDWVDAVLLARFDTP